ncbi:Hypothetical predicted protein [Olea europaea subsp. europaea]|uniref:Uncharacterized protein n=1 Tax=Olea europaea subsp. europaea TaxID=158383 RepID=A0A8S0RCC6_OLEEU|nr:Hypothetical predicted protein [Olea europaea subsp. europaea]
MWLSLYHVSTSNSKRDAVEEQFASSPEDNANNNEHDEHTKSFTILKSPSSLRVVEKKSSSETAKNSGDTFRIIIKWTEEDVSQKSYSILKTMTTLSTLPCLLSNLQLVMDSEDEMRQKT